MRVAPFINFTVKFYRGRRLAPKFVLTVNLRTRMRKDVSSKSDSAVARFSERESNLPGPRKIGGFTDAIYRRAKEPRDRSFLSLAPLSRCFAGSCITPGTLVTGTGFLTY